MLVFDLDNISYFTNLRSFQVKYSSNFKSILYCDFQSAKYVLFLDKTPKIKIEDLEIDPIESVKFPLKLDLNVNVSIEDKKT